ncbi:hypothetical protein ACTSEZ_09715 [Metabacillus sp. JX24]|uniref:hypothetical protein n=1 Tax=Metabacillus sp. JX24 TaxID=3240759 RepID=UPI00350F848D
MKLLLFLMAVIPLFAAGCSNGTAAESIEVLQRIGDENKYDDFNVITDNEKVKKAEEIVDDADWENVKVDMARPADFQFSFPNPEAKVALFELWISPNKDKVELAIDAESKYIQLDKNKSAELFEILTGEQLSEQK